MLAVISPAKNMNMAKSGHACSAPAFEADAQRLAARMREFAPWELESVLGVNPELALRAFSAYQNFDANTGTSSALLAYDGLVYKHIGADGFDGADMDFADGHVRILSALYGMLRPLDGIRPHRLEMQTRLAVGDAPNLYAYWGRRLYEALFAQGQPVINLASGEYARTFHRYLTPADRCVDIVFLAHYKGKRKTLPAWAKMARGEMVRFIVQNRLEQPEQLLAFDWNGYAYADFLSDSHTYVFLQRS